MYRSNEETLDLPAYELNADFNYEVEKVCSICGRTHIFTFETNTWHQIAEYHCDKGADFRSTYKFYDVCSFECYLKQVRKSAEGLKNFKTGRIDGMDLNFVQKLLFFYSTYFQ